MAHYPTFPRFPFSFNDNITRKMWELNENWANHLRGSLETQDATVIKRKVAGDMRYNTSTNKFQGWNGSAWQDFN